MKAKRNLQALQRHIAIQKRFAPRIRPTVPFDIAAFDNSLPEHGFTIDALHEFLPAAEGDIASTIGFSFCLLARIIRTRPGLILWSFPSYQTFRQGALYPIGLMAMGFDPDRLIQVKTPKSQDTLWALEEGLTSSTLAAVIGVLPENERIYDFTASRRLAMRAAENRVTVLLIRNRPTPEMATAAETRWLVSAEPSTRQHYIGRAMGGLGAPRWQIQLAKSKGGTPGCWKVEWDHETLSFRMAASMVDRTPIQTDRGVGQKWAAAS